MTVARACGLEQVEQDGFVLLPGVFSAEQVDAILQGLGTALARASATPGTILGHSGGTYAARNVLALWPAVAELWHQQPVPQTLAAILGPAFGLVRVLFFDKPPEQSWALPWHKDLTIAVRDNRLPSDRFRNPTRKAGVPHVEAPPEVLRAMLTARVHLDDVTDENGPLRVIPGSHRSGKVLELGAVTPRSILARCGDVLLMRPLLAHCSNRSQPGTPRHRRVLHLEFAASADLPDGYTWHTFLPAPRPGLPVG